MTIKQKKTMCGGGKEGGSEREREREGENIYIVKSIFYYIYVNH